MKSEQDINHLCKKFTDLSMQEIEVLLDQAQLLVQISMEEQVDVFINCMCKNKKETLTVAFSHCDDSVYNMSTIGYVIRETDEPAVFRTVYYGVETKDVKAVSYVTTQGNMIIQHAIPIKCGDRTIGALVRERPITLEMQEEIESVKKRWMPTNSEQYSYLKNLDLLAECVDSAVIILNQDGYVVYRNIQAATIYLDYGYIHDILGKKYSEISIHGEVSVSPGIENAYREGEFTCIGNYYRIKQYCYLANEYFFILLISDVTKEKQNEESLVLKSVAIREAHHRIKNNLQTISSLLEMQYRRVSSGEAAAALQDAMVRIMSISTSYEALLIRGMDMVSLRSVVLKIRNKFMDLIVDSPLEIQITVRGDDFDTDADTSTNIALVINELLQNSFKYAFVGRKGGNIDITITERPVYSELEVTDDGIGFDISNTENAKSSLGLQIADNIIKSKLKGRLDIQSSEKGTTVKFDFKTYKK